MAQTIATAYVDIMPSTRGLKAALDKEVTPVARATGTTAGRALGDGIVAGAGPQVSAGMKRILEKVATDGKVTFGTKIRGIGQSLTDEFAQTGKISGTLRTVGQSMDVTGGKARGLVEKFGAITNGSTGMTSGLSAVSSVLLGPWGIAIAGAGLALGSFVEQQAAAKEAAKQFASTLDEVTGGLTKASFQNSAKSVVDRLLDPGSGQAAVTLDQLRQMGFTLEEITGAVTRGGPAYDALIGKIEAYNSQQNKLFDSAALERGYTLQRVVEGVSRDTQQGTVIQNAATAAMNAGAVAAGGVADSLKAAAAATQAQARAAADSSTQQTIFDQAMQSIANQAEIVRDRIDGIPKDVRITAKAVGLDAITRAADAAAAAYLRMAAAASAANNIVADGERHGADLGGASPAGQAGNRANAVAAAARAARKAARDAIRTRNQSLDSRSSAAASRAASAAATARKAARSALLDSVGGTFARDTTGLDTEGLDKLTRDLVGKAKDALSGAKETRLVNLLKRDNTKLKGLATQRAAIQKQIAEDESKLSDLKSQKASTVSSVSSSMMGNLVGARSASGIKRVLTKQLAQVKAFGANIRALAKRGLPNVFLKQLLDAGLDGAATAAALVRSNGADFETIKNLTNELSTEANKLGVDAGSILYDEGIATMQGLIDGLKSKDKALEEQMLTIARSMKKAIRKALGIASPSKVFEHYGRMTGKGMAVGVDKSSAEVNRSIVGMVRIPQQKAAQRIADANARAGSPVNVHVHHADVHGAARSVVDELVWRAKR